MEDDSQPSLPPLPKPARPLQFNKSNVLPASQLFADWSSEPAAFSSDDDPSVENYAPGRRKRRRIGSWFHHSTLQQPSSDGPDHDEVSLKRAKRTNSTKSRQLARDADSGVWLASDDNIEDQSGQSWLPMPMLPAARLATGYVRSSSMRMISMIESSARDRVQEFINDGNETVDLSAMGLDAISGSTIQPLSGLRPIPTVVKNVAFEYREPSLKLLLGSNRLSKIPAAICDLGYLTVLSIRGNRLRELPASISKLRNLTSLNVAQNSLRWLPRELLDLVTSSDQPIELHLHPNPWCMFDGERARPVSTAINIQFLENEANATIEYNPPTNRDPEMDEDGMKVWLPFPRSATVDSNHQSHTGFLVARSAVQYCNGHGRPSDPEIDLDQIGTRGAHLPTIGLFSDVNPPLNTAGTLKPTRCRTLLELALEVCRRASSSTDLKEMMPTNSPDYLIKLLDRVVNQQETGGYRCARAGCSDRPDAVIPATQWIEWWHLGSLARVERNADGEPTEMSFRHLDALPVPFVSRGCSWGCVPDVPKIWRPAPTLEKVLLLP